jgi:hypothetical protein
VPHHSKCVHSVKHTCNRSIFLSRVRRAASLLRARRCRVRLSALSCFRDDTRPADVFSGVGAPLPSPTASLVCLNGSVLAGGSDEVGLKSGFALYSHHAFHVNGKQYMRTSGCAFVSVLLALDLHREWMKFGEIHRHSDVLEWVTCQCTTRGIQDRTGRLDTDACGLRSAGNRAGSLVATREVNSEPFASRDPSVTF